MVVLDREAAGSSPASFSVARLSVGSYETDAAGTCSRARSLARSLSLSLSDLSPRGARSVWQASSCESASVRNLREHTVQPCMKHR